MKQSKKDKRKKKQAIKQNKIQICEIDTTNVILTKDNYEIELIRQWS